jgi:hypothetical protein
MTNWSGQSLAGRGEIAAYDDHLRVEQRYQPRKGAPDCLPGVLKHA